MNLNQLKIFYLAVKHGSLSMAARQLNITQPAVTKGIQRLQDYYDVRFLNRFGKKMALTDAGEALFRIAEKIFDLDLLAEDCIRDFQKDERGHIRIDASESFGAYYLPSIVNPFSRTHPQLRISANILPTEQVADNTAALKNDIGFTSYPVKLNKLVSRQILEEQLVIIAPPDHPFCGRPHIRPADLEGQSIVVHEIGSVPHTAINRVIKENHLTVSIPMELSSNRAIKKAVESGAGIALICRNVAREEVANRRLCAIPLADPGMTRGFYMIHHREKYISRPLSAFIKRVDQWAARYGRS